MVSACMLIRTEGGKCDSVVGRLKQIPDVKAAFTILGRYDVAVDIESRDYKELGRSILKVNKLAGVVFTETLPEVES